MAVVGLVAKIMKATKVVLLRLGIGQHSDGVVDKAIWRSVHCLVSAALVDASLISRE